MDRRHLGKFAIPTNCPCCLQIDRDPRANSSYLDLSKEQKPRVLLPAHAMLKPASVPGCSCKRKQRTDVAIENEILAYLAENPDAQDTLDGIVQSWLWDRHTKAEVQTALIVASLERNSRLGGCASWTAIVGREKSDNSRRFHSLSGRKKQIPTSGR